MDIYFYYIPLGLLLFFFIVQLYYLLIVQGKLSFYKTNLININQTNFPVSVIICARNEAENLRQFLPFVLNQKYADFEVVVVNDCSYDDSEDLLKEFKTKFTNLKIVNIEEHIRYKTAKKFAVTLGIKAATHEYLVFTDADCKPESEFWLALMMSNYANNETEIVLGYSPYQKMSGFLNKFIRYETFQTALNYFSFTLNRMPYMGVGRNLSYKKSLFFKSKGFASHMHIPSGDDDLFVNQNATKKNVAIELTKDSHVISNPKDSWISYWRQKTRHIGAGGLYQNHHRFNLSLQFLSAVFFYLLIVLCLIFKISPLIVGIVYILRLLTQLFVYFRPMTMLRDKDLIWWYVFLDPFYYCYLLTISFIGLFRRKKTWN